MLKGTLPLIDTNFQCRGYCPRPVYLWNETEMAKFGAYTDEELPLQIGVIPKRDPWDPLVGYK